MMERLFVSLGLGKNIMNGVLNMDSQKLKTMKLCLLQNQLNQIKLDEMKNVHVVQIKNIKNVVCKGEKMNVLQKTKIKKKFNNAGIQVNVDALNMMDEKIDKIIDGWVDSAKRGNVKRVTPDLMFFITV